MQRTWGYEAIVGPVDTWDDHPVVEVWVRYLFGNRPITTTRIGLWEPADYNLGIGANPDLMKVRRAAVADAVREAYGKENVRLVSDLNMWRDLQTFLAPCDGRVDSLDELPKAVDPDDLICD